MQINDLYNQFQLFCDEKKESFNADSYIDFFQKLETSEERFSLSCIFSEYNGEIHSKKYPDFLNVKISVLSNFTATPIADYLRSYCISQGIHCDMLMSDGEQYIYQMLDNNSEFHQFKPDVTLLLLDEHFIINSLPYPWNFQEIENAIEKAKKDIENTIHQFQSRLEGMLVINLVPISQLTLSEILDYETKTKVNIIWDDFNRFVQSLSLENSQLIVINTHLLLQNANVNQLRDERLSVYAKMHMDNSLLDAIACELAIIVRTLLGKSSKCLVVDCDNTLWGGVVADDGVDNIQLGFMDEGEAFLQLQKTIKQFKHQGVLLAINSKNDREVIEEVFNSHNNMALELDEFITIRANWEPKHENINSIVRDLNIGEDSLVFIDDNPSECELVQSYRPLVKTIHLDGEVYDFRKKLLGLGLFNKLNITKEDFKRSELYKQEKERSDFFDLSNSLSDFLFRLEIKVKFEWLGPENSNRLSQLSMRTNQFNMTGIRYSIQELDNIQKDKQHTAVAVRASDKFGDQGIVGAVFLRIIEKENTLSIENLLLSCRVFSRDIESVTLTEVIDIARFIGCDRIIARYIETEKNKKIRNFYKNYGFQLIQGGNNIYLFEHKLLEPLKESPFIVVEKASYEKLSISRLKEKDYAVNY